MGESREKVQVNSRNPAKTVVAQKCPDVDSRSKDYSQTPTKEAKDSPK